MRLHCLSSACLQCLSIGSDLHCAHAMGSGSWGIPGLWHSHTSSLFVGHRTEGALSPYILNPSISKWHVSEQRRRLNGALPVYILPVELPLKEHCKLTCRLRNPIMKCPPARCPLLGPLEEHHEPGPLPRGQKIDANFFCTKFFNNPSGHGRPR